MKRSAWVAVAGTAVTVGMLAARRLWGRSSNVAATPESRRLIQSKRPFKNRPPLPRVPAQRRRSPSAHPLDVERHRARRWWRWSRWRVRGRGSPSGQYVSEFADLSARPTKPETILKRPQQNKRVTSALRRPAVQTARQSSPRIQRVPVGSPNRPPIRPPILAGRTSITPPYRARRPQRCARNRPRRSSGRPGGPRCGQASRPSGPPCAPGTCCRSRAAASCRTRASSFRVLHDCPRLRPPPRRPTRRRRTLRRRAEPAAPRRPSCSRSTHTGCPTASR